MNKAAKTHPIFAGHPRREDLLKHKPQPTPIAGPFLLARLEGVIAPEVFVSLNTDHR
jgi:hypothetical protein